MSFWQVQLEGAPGAAQAWGVILGSECNCTEQRSLIRSRYVVMVEELVQIIVSELRDGARNGGPCLWSKLTWQAEAAG